ncbi:MAG: cobaltochelatase CobT-related protein, partial [Anaerolineales bacterium]
HLMFASQRLQTRHEPGKVLLVVSDGQPNGDANHLIEAVKRIESTGTKVVAIGIGADFVCQVYSNAVVVEDFRQMVNELTEVLAREFRTRAV